MDGNLSLIIQLENLQKLYSKYRAFEDLRGSSIV